MEKQVELTKEEKQLIERAAEQAGLTVEQYMDVAVTEFLKHRLGAPKKYN